jgi:ribosomal-protein-alanine N-acetyltransferase
MKFDITHSTERINLIEAPAQKILSWYSALGKEKFAALLQLDEYSADRYDQMCTKGMETFRISQFYFLIQEKSSGKIIGECGYHTWNPTHRRADLFYYLNKDEYKNKGYMSELLPWVIEYGFQTMNLHRIAAFIDQNNIPSLKLLTKMGFRFEGIAREDYVVDGIPCDSHCYSLLVSDQ